MIDRKEQLAEMARLQAELPQLAVVHGRRRVGKSYLLNHGLSLPRVISYQAAEGLRETQLALFAEEAARLLPGSPPLRFDSWNSALQFVDAQLGEGALALVLDEYQYLHAKDASLDSTLMRWWDVWERRRAPIFLVICGSGISLMRELVEGNKALFGRAGWRPRIDAFDYRVAAEFAPAGLTAEEKLVRFAVLGGAAQYQVWGGSRPLKKIICEAILSKDGPMYEEPSNLLRGETEIREPAGYFSLLRYMSEGKSRIGEIASAAETSTARVTKLLRLLERLGYVEQRKPLGKGGGQPYWRIVEPFHRFWFRYVYPNASRLERGLIDAVYQEVETDLPQYMGQAFEDCCRTWVGKYSQWAGQLYEIGSWWSGSAEFDVLATNRRGYGVLGACEWTKRAKTGLLTEATTARDMMGREARSPDLLLFARGFDPHLVAKASQEGAHLIGLENLFETNSA